MTEDKDRLSELYRSADLPNSPQQLDKAVLSLAAELAPAQVTRLPRWLPLASAASVVAFTVVLVFQDGNPPPAPNAAAEFQMGAPQEATVELEADVKVKADLKIEAEISPARAAAPQAMDLDAEVHSDAVFAKSSAMAAPTQERRQEEVGRSAARLRQLPNTGANEAVLADAPIDDDAISPQQWLANIKELLVAGDRSRAVSQFKLFREQYPDFSIPADLEKKFSEAEASLPEPKI